MTLSSTEIDENIDQIKLLTAHLPPKEAAPSLICAAIDLLADNVACKHTECFLEGVEILAKLMAAHTLLTIKRRGFEETDEEVQIH